MGDCKLLLAEKYGQISPLTIFYVSMVSENPSCAYFEHERIFVLQHFERSASALEMLTLPNTKFSQTKHDSIHSVHASMLCLRETYACERVIYASVLRGCLYIPNQLWEWTTSVVRMAMVMRSVRIL